ncbi:MAG: YdbL family protein [Desulfobacteraceae bacterium]|nr:YdbL family protein [Desulfobacteraceae bacterium]
MKKRISSFKFQVSSFKFQVSLLLLVFCLTCVSSFAEGIKSRMIKRLPVIKELKVKGIIGENNKGYLEFTGKKKEKQDVIDAENSDRKKIYEAIAKQQKTKLEIVEKHRAVQIEKKAAKGEWLQDANGKWYKK